MSRKTRVRSSGGGIEVSGSGANMLFAAFEAGEMKDASQIRSRLCELEGQSTPYAAALRDALVQRLKRLVADTV